MPCVLAVVRLRLRSRTVRRLVPRGVRTSAPIALVSVPVVGDAAVPAHPRRTRRVTGKRRVILAGLLCCCRNDCAQHQCDSDCNGAGKDRDHTCHWFFPVLQLLERRNRSDLARAPNQWCGGPSLWDDGQRTSYFGSVRRIHWGKSEQRRREPAYRDDPDGCLAGSLDPPRRPVVGKTRDGEVKVKELRNRTENSIELRSVDRERMEQRYRCAMVLDAPRPLGESRNRE